MQSETLKLDQPYSLTKDKEIFIALYPNTNNKNLARLFNRSVSRIQVFAIRCKIKKSPSYMENLSGRFTDGHIPANKGIKGTHSSPATEFKPGHIPANHKSIGTISVRNNYKRSHNYKYIKIAEPNKWKEYHRYLWEKEHGPVPKGMKLVFKNGDTTEVRLSNLELITAIEHLNRNRNYKKMRKTMCALWEIEKLRVKYGRPQQTKLRINNLNCYK